VVGFFGKKQPQADYSLVDPMDEQLVEEFLEYPDLLTYNTFQKLDGEFCNLVLFSRLQGLGHWAMGTTHAKAVEISPSYYTSIRLHTTFLPGGFLSDQGLTLHRTKYFSYEGESVWAAVREFQPPLL